MKRILMKRRPLLRAARAVCTLAATVAAWWFLGDWLAADACLDHGGAFDYGRWRCDLDTDEAHAYVAGAAFSRPSFGVFCLSATTAIGAWWAPAYRPLRRPSA